ncbi:MAG: GMC family oxidoreductase, partial [Gemmatimonadetes bacterium]|nr:GMC family oxidoreductase [Gemmatimonadota bacterium]
LLLDGAIALVLFALYQGAWASRFQPRFLEPTEYRALIALAGVVLEGKDPKLSAYDIAANADRYLSSIRARRRWIYHAVLFGLQLHPLLYLKAPFSELDPLARLGHLKAHFYRDVILRLVPDWWRRMVQAMVRVAKQVCYVGYYNDRRSYASVGYQPFTERDRYRQLEQSGKIPPPQAHPLSVVNGADLEPGAVLETDVCVIGSGAAGALMAHGLAKQGRDVLVVERGQYVEPRHFNSDEVEMIGRLYADGVFQQTEDFRFTILQGSCVGGSTTVNNAVCFDPPDRVLERWNDPAVHHAGLDLDEVRASVKAVRKFLDIGSQAGAPLNPSAVKFVAGAAGPTPVAGQLQVDPVEANIKDCLGCGYCNIGCAYGKKLSMLDTALPWAQRDFGSRVRIVSDCEVTRLRVLSGRPQRVLDARAVTPKGRQVTIRARTFVVSAGAIASSYLLRRSGIGRGLPVGRQMSFNMGSPLTAEFDDPMDAYDGLQISHYGLPHPERGFVLETWWNPPATQAVNMPGWFEDHFDNMRRYRYLMAVGVLVGTRANAYLREALTGGPGVVFTPEAEDLRKLGDGLAQVAEILFAAGARRVMANTWGYDVLTHPNQVGELYRIAGDPAYITLGTGHPQGGNALSADPERGVVGPDFRVHGFGNLCVCDASVFPSSVTVNPQLTVMSLAHYAARRIG